MKILLTATLGGTLFATAAWAGQADVVEATAHREGDGTYRFEVAVRHDDAGWQHYADRWDILTADGAILGSRELLHPHEDEQPFTRSLGGVRVPAAVRQVQIRAHDKVHGNGGKTLTIDLP